VLPAGNCKVSPDGQQCVYVLMIGTAGVDQDLEHSLAWVPSSGVGDVVSQDRRVFGNDGKAAFSHDASRRGDLLFKGEEAKRDFSGEHGRIRRRGRFGVGASRGVSQGCSSK